MNRDYIIRQVTRPFRKSFLLSIAAILCALVLINTPADMLGYWLFGASLVWFGLNLRLNSDTKSSVVLCTNTGSDHHGMRIIEAEGIKVQAAPDMIESIKNAQGYSRIKGTLLIFHNGEEPAEPGEVVNSE